MDKRKDFLRPIPEKLLPSGWEVTYMHHNCYRITCNGYSYDCALNQSASDSWLYNLLKHIDPGEEQ